ncbi:GAF domain-containing protein [bacterium]|nr:GAF domain-containing protein [bacterium]
MADNNLADPEAALQAGSKNLRAARLEALYDLSLAIFSAVSIDQLLVDVMERVTGILGVDRSTLFIVDREEGILWSKVAQKTDPIRIPLGSGLAGYVARSGEVLNIPDAYADDRFNPEVDRRTGFHTRNLLCIPVRNRENEIIAVIQAINKNEGCFDREDEGFLFALSAQIQLAIENASLYEDLKELFESMMEALAFTIDARHPTTAGHTLRVRDYSLAIARELGYQGNDLEILNYAALLHDYGKIGVPEAILTKPGRLTDAEYGSMKKHVVFTQEILQRIKFAQRFRDIPAIAGQHHERVDGGGYPGGLTGPEMHPMARIMAVADVFDAMTSVREYRQPADPDEVLAMLRKETGTHFDHETVEAFARYFERSHLGDQIRRRNQMAAVMNSEPSGRPSGELADQAHLPASPA